jgi:hypothetical protein
LEPDCTRKKKEEIRVSKPKVLIVVGDAAETVDTLYPYYRLIEGGYQPVVTAPEKRLYQMVLHEVKPGWTITKEWEGYSINAEIAFKDIQPEEYVGIFFSGGRAPEYIRDDADLLRVTGPAGWRIRSTLNVAREKFGSSQQATHATHMIVTIAANFVAHAIQNQSSVLEIFQRFHDPLESELVPFFIRPKIPRHSSVWTEHNDQSLFTSCRHQ